MSDLSKTLIGVMKDVSNGAIPTNILIATVVSSPEGLSIKFGNEVIPPEQIYCSNYLLPHYHRDYTIKGTVDMYDFDNTTNTAGCPVDGGTPAIPKLKGSGKYETHGDIWFEDTLEAGDEVLCVLAGVNWVVVSKVTKMPNKAIEGV